MIRFVRRGPASLLRQSRLADVGRESIEHEMDSCAADRPAWSGQSPRLSTAMALRERHTNQPQGTVTQRVSVPCGCDDFYRRRGCCRLSVGEPVATCFGVRICWTEAPAVVRRRAASARRLRTGLRLVCWMRVIKTRAGWRAVVSSRCAAASWRSSWGLWPRASASARTVARAGQSASVRIRSACSGTAARTSLARVRRVSSFGRRASSLISTGVRALSAAAWRC